MTQQRRQNSKDTKKGSEQAKLSSPESSRVTQGPKGSLIQVHQGVLPLTYVGLTSGLQQKELLSLKWNDFDGQGRIYKGKRLLTIDPKAMQLLHDEYSCHPDQEEVFPNPKTGQAYLSHEFYYLHQKVLKAAHLHPISFRELAKNCRGVEL